MRKVKEEKSAKSAKPQEENGFVPDGVASGSSSYMKLSNGENKFRVISNAVAGWIDWLDKKPIRTPLEDGEPEANDDEMPPKKFLAMAVIDLEDDQVKIMELKQQSVIKAIKALTNNKDWGSPFSYDITIKKEGEGMKTKYTVTPSPKRKLSKDEIKLANAKPCNLERLFDNEDPWKLAKGEEATEYFLNSK